MEEVVVYKVGKDLFEDKEKANAFEAEEMIKGVFGAKSKTEIVESLARNAQARMDLIDVFDKIDKLYT